MKKSSENKLYLELNNIQNDIFENYKNAKMTPEKPINKKFKQSCKEASNENKFRKQTSQN